MENLESNASVVNGDLLELSPLRMPNPILKPSQKDNLIMLQTPVQKNLKVSFITPKRTPMRHNGMLQNGAFIGGLHRPASVTKAPIQSGSAEGAAKSLLRILLKAPNLQEQKESFKSIMETNLEGSSNVNNESDTSFAAKWESLRKLDEKSRWRDRVEVITKLDHEEHQKYAHEVISEIISRSVDISDAKAFDNNSASETLASTCSDDKLLQPFSLEAQSYSNLDTKVSNHDRHNTYDVASPFLMANSDKLPLISPAEECQVKRDTPPTTVNDMDSIKIPQNIKPKMVSSVVKPERSLSANTDAPSKDVKPVPKARYQSLDFNQIGCDFDPFLSRSDRDPTDVSKQQSEIDSLNQSVFSPATSAANQPQFALRAVDSIFGDNDFVDSKEILDQGHLDLDYLEKKTPGTISADLQKESLYVRFDPLLEGLGSRQSIALLGRKSDIIDFSGRVTPVPEDVNEVSSKLPDREPDLLCDSPARLQVNDTLIVESKPESINSQSGSTSSPMSHNQEKPLDNGIIEVLKYTDTDLERVLQKIRDKRMKERAQITERNTSMEEKLKQLKIVHEDLLQRCEEKSLSLVKESTEAEEHMAYQKGEQQMVNAGSKELTDKMSALFRKMETLQSVVTNYKSNETSLKERTKLMEEKKSLSHTRCKELEEMAKGELKKVESEKSAVEANFSAQMNNLKMKIRAAELRAESLQTTLTHKQKEKEELLKICDELVASNETRPTL